MHDHDYGFDPTCPHCLGAALDDDLGQEPYALARKVARRQKYAKRRQSAQYKRVVRRAAGRKFQPSRVSSAPPSPPGRRRTSGSTVSAMRRSGGSIPRRRTSGSTVAAMRRSGGSIPGRRTSGSTVGPMIRGRGGRRRFGRKGQRLRKMRFSRIRRRLARRLGLKVQKTQSGYSYPQIPQQVEQGIPNYYAESRQERMLEDIPPEESTFARKIGRFIFEQLPDDPDRGKTVEETIANVLDFAANRALAADDQENADQLIKIGKKWRQSIGKKQAAIDPDAPLDEANEEDGETGFIGLLTVVKPRSHKTLAVAGLSAVIAGLIAYSRAPKKKADRRALMAASATALGATILLNRMKPAQTAEIEEIE